MTPDIHPIVLFAIGWYFCWSSKRGITAYTIAGECLGVLFGLSIYPLVKYLVVEHFAGIIEIENFSTYLMLNLFLMIGRSIEWSKARRRNRG